MGTQSSRKARDPNQQQYYYHQTVPPTQQRRHSSTSSETTTQQQQQPQQQQHRVVTDLATPAETSESRDTTSSSSTTSASAEVRPKPREDRSDEMCVDEHELVKGHVTDEHPSVTSELVVVEQPCSSSDSREDRLKPVKSITDANNLPSYDMYVSHVGPSDKDLVGLSPADNGIRNISSSAVGVFPSPSADLTLKAQQPDTSTAEELAHRPFSQVSVNRPILLEPDNPVLTDFTSSRSQTSSRSSASSLSEELPEIDEFEEQQAKQQRQQQLPYRWYSWPADFLPPTLMKSDGVREMLRTLRGQTAAGSVDRDGFDEDEEEDDFELLELASRLHRDEMDKKAQIQEGSGLMGPATLPAFFVPETLQPATTQKVIETTDPKKKVVVDDLVPCAFNWSHGGHSIYLTGSFDGWETDRKIKLVRSGHEFTAIKELPRAVHYYKFIVDDQWKFAPNQPTHTDERGNVNNVLDLSDYQVYNFTVAKEHEQAREAAYHQFVPGSNDYTTDAPVIPMLLSKSHCVATDPPSRISTPLHALSNHLYHDSHAAHLFGPHIASVTSTQRWRHSHISPLSTAGLRFSTLIYVTFNPLFLLHGDANFELYAASPLRSLIFRRNSRNTLSDNSTSADGVNHPKDDSTTSSRHDAQVHDDGYTSRVTSSGAVVGTFTRSVVGTSPGVSVGTRTGVSVETCTSVSVETSTSVSVGHTTSALPVLNNFD